jgi:hypothetical protein
MKVSLIALLGIAACGGTSNGGSGDGGITGAVSGVSLNNVVEGGALISTVACGTTPPPFFVNIDLANRAGVCAGAKVNTLPGSLTDLSFVVERFYAGNALNEPSTTPAIAAGTYTVGTSGLDAAGFRVGVAANFDASDASCNSTLAGGQQATAGTVTLTEVSSAGAAGSFNFTFPGGALSGSFDVPACVLTTEQICINAAPACSG